MAELIPDWARDTRSPTPASFPRVGFVEQSERDADAARIVANEDGPPDARNPVSGIPTATVIAGAGQPADAVPDWARDTTPAPRAQAAPAALAPGLATDGQGSTFRYATPEELKTAEKPAIAPRLNTRRKLDTSTLDIGPTGEAIKLPGSVLDNFVAEPEKPLIEARGAPVSDEEYRRLKRELDAATPERRRELYKRPDYRGSVAHAILDEYEAQDRLAEKTPSMGNATGRVEDRAARARRAGAAPGVAENIAAGQLAFGQEEPLAQARASSKNLLADAAERIATDKAGIPKRVWNDFESGVIGSAGATISYAGRKSGSDSLTELGEAMNNYAERKTPTNATFADQIVNAVGSMASFYIPGLGVAKGTAALSTLAPTLAKWTGAGTMAAFEAAAEADQVYRELIKQGRAPDEAAQNADKTFLANLPLLVVTDKIGLFNDIKTLGRKVATTAIAEGPLQEGPQQVIQNYFTGKPLSEGVAEATAIGSLVGGGSAAVIHAVTPPDVKPQTAQDIWDAKIGTFARLNPAIKAIVADKPATRAILTTPIQPAEDAETALERQETPARGAGQSKETPAPAAESAAPAHPTWDTLQPGQNVTLYRGESADNDANGQWWTTDRAKAARYGTVSEVTLPAETVAANAARGHNGADEFVFPDKRPGDLVATSNAGTRAAPITVTAPEHLEQAGEVVNTEPTDAEKAAGNYSKAHITLQGIPISIENIKGSERRGVGPDGKPWTATLPESYGYIKRSEGADGEHVDVFIGEAVKSPSAFIIDQIDPKTGLFDEHKTMLGFATRKDAVKAYEAAFSDGSGPKRMGAITSMSVEKFKEWLKSGDTTLPVKYREPVKGEAKAQTIADLIPELKALRSQAQGKGSGATLQAALVRANGLQAGTRGPDEAEWFERQAEALAEKHPEAADVLRKVVAAIAPETKQNAPQRDAPKAAPKVAEKPKPPRGARERMAETQPVIKIQGRAVDKIPLPQLRRYAAKGGPEVKAKARAEIDLRASIAEDGKRAAQERKEKRNTPSARLLALVNKWGIKPKEAPDILGERNAVAAGAGKLFRDGGLGIDDVALYLHERHWITDAEFNEVDGGTQRARDMIRDALEGKLEPVLVDAVEREGRAALENRIVHDETEAVGLPTEDASKVDELARALDSLTPDEIAQLDGQAQNENLSDAAFRALVIQSAQDKLNANQRPDAQDLGSGQEGRGAPSRAAPAAEASPGEGLELTPQSNADILAGEQQQPAAETKAIVDREAALPLQLQAPAGSVTADPLSSPKNQQGLFTRKSDEPAFSRAPVFYSELSKKVGEFKSNAAPAQAWKSAIRNLTTRGVKQDEIEWSGVNDWLEAKGNAKVSKQEIADFLDKNGVQVQEVTLGETERDAPEDLAKRKAVFDEYQPRIDELRRKHAALSGKEGVMRERLNLLQEAEDLEDERDAAANKVYALKADSAVAPKFSRHTLPGGENYKELLLTLPQKDNPRAAWKATYVGDAGGGLKQYEVVDGNGVFIGSTSAMSADHAIQRISPRAGEGFRSSHFDEPNILAHVRFNERTDAEGKRVLFIEELQSDWAQKGRREGFNAKEPMREVLWDDIALDGGAHSWTATAPGHRSVEIGKGTVQNETEARDYAQRYFNNNAREHNKNAQLSGVPSAPFVGKTEAWTALALKRMIRYAAENGFDRVAWTNGDQQASRYDLSKQISEIQATRTMQGAYHVIARNNVMREGQGRPIHDDVVSEQKLPDIVGKELADKIVAQGDGVKTYSGLDLKVGGEGMRSFYDRIVPNVANDVLKKLGGGRVGEVMLSTIHDDQVMAQMLKESGAIIDTAQPGFDITPAMREKAMGGLPLFRRGPESGTLSTSEVRSILSEAIDKVSAPVDIFPDTESAARATGIDVPADAHGVSYDKDGIGRIAIIAGNMRDALHAEITFWHEAFHTGYRSRDYERALTRVAMANPDVRGRAAAWREQFASERFAILKERGITGAEAQKDVRILSWEEAVADISGENRGQPLKLVDHLIAALQRMLRGMGLTRLANFMEGKTHAEVLALIQQSIDQIPKPGAQMLTASNAPAYMRAAERKPGLLNTSAEVSTNDDGKRADQEAAPRQTDTDAFRKWFGDSKVVGENGNPLVVYHGAPDARFVAEDGTFKTLKEKYGATDDAQNRAFWFSASRRTAQTYANDHRAFDYQAAEPGVIAAYLRLKNPLVVDAKGKPWRDAQQRGKTGDVIDEARKAGHDGVIIRNVLDDYQSGVTPSRRNEATDTYAVFSPTQIKSTGNSGTFDATNPDIRFSRRTPGIEGLPAAERKSITRKAMDFAQDFLSSTKEVTLWQKTVGTQGGKARAMPETFGRVFDHLRDYQMDASAISIRSQMLMPHLIPLVESARDVVKDMHQGVKGLAGKGSYPSRDDVHLASDALFAGTLFDPTASPLQGRRFTHEELSTGQVASIDRKAKPVKMRQSLATQVIKQPRFAPLTPKAIVAYDEALDAVARTVDEMAKSGIYRLQRSADFGLDKDFFMDKSLPEVAEKVKIEIDRRLSELIAQDETPQIEKQMERLGQLYNEVDELETNATQLREHGYFPLQRFGRYTLEISKADDRGKHVKFFGMYPWEHQRNAALRVLSEDTAFKGHKFTKGIADSTSWQMYKGLSPDIAELFAKHISTERIVQAGEQSTIEQVPLSEDQTFQSYLRHAISNRSALKQHIHRKGVMGFTRDISRVTANFLASGGRAAAANYHMADAIDAWDEIPKENGDVRDEAFKLIDHMRNPKEEAGAIRNFLFFMNLGGSIAATAINMTQVPQVTLPYLTKYTSYNDAAQKWLSRMPTTAEFRAALEKAKREGIVAPQEIHQLQGEARAQVFGLDMPSQAQRALHRFNTVWGAGYSIAEQYNREQTFKIAWQVAKELGPEALEQKLLAAGESAERAKTRSDPYEFAKLVIDDTQFIYGKIARPNLGRGAVGATVFTFTQFNISAAEMIATAAKHNKKTAAYMLLTLFFMAGAEGEPFAENIEDIIDSIGQWMGYATNSKKTLREKLGDIIGADWAEVVLTGVAGRAGLDLSTRFGMGRIIPGTQALKPSNQHALEDALKIIGPIGGLLEKGHKAAQDLFKGNFAQAVKDMLPKALSDAAKGAEMARTGEYRNDKHQLQMTTTLGEAAAKAAGFNPTRIGERGRLQQMVKQDIDLRQEVKKAIMGKRVQSSLEQDPKLKAELKAEADEQLADWNSKNPKLHIKILPADVVKAKADANRDANSRFLKHLPKAMRGDSREFMEENKRSTPLGP